MPVRSGVDVVDRLVGPLGVRKAIILTVAVHRPRRGRRAQHHVHRGEYNHFRWWDHAGATLIDASVEELCVRDYLPWHCIVAYNGARDSLVDDIRQVAAARHWTVQFPLLTGQYPAGTGTDGVGYDGAVRLVTVTAAQSISWTTTATSLRGKTGEFEFVCPTAGNLYGVAGTDTYTDDSSICTAAVHAGVITRAGGGTVTIVPSAGLSSYTGTTRNGVTSRSYAGSFAAFTFA